jgi:hypothetical protein
LTHVVINLKKDPKFPKNIVFQRNLKGPRVNRI